MTNLWRSQTFPQGGFCETGSVDLRELHLEKNCAARGGADRRVGVDAVIHFAASIVPDSVSNPLVYYRMGAQAFRAQPLTAGSPILLKMPPAGWNGSRLLQSHRIMNCVPG